MTPREVLAAYDAACAKLAELHDRGHYTGSEHEHAEDARDDAASWLIGLARELIG